jgi:uncharacterized protein
MNYPKLNPRFTHWRLRVGRSTIHRRGVFTTEDIPSHRQVVEYTGERITRREAVERFEKIWHSRKRNKLIYLFQVSTRWVIDGAVGGSGAELVNHACDPNLRARRIRGRIFYFSRRPLRKGDELTLDYRYPKEPPRVACRCGSPACRGTINRN